MIKRTFSILILTLVFASSLLGCSNSKSIEKKSEPAPTFKEAASTNVLNDNQNNISDSTNPIVDELTGDIKTYTDKRFKFSVDYPAHWDSKVEKSWGSTKDHEASPDSGINIYVDDNKEDRIYVFAQVGHISISGNYKIDKFETKSGLTGDLYRSEDEGKIELILLLADQFGSASIHMSLDSFKRNEKQVMGILGSIKFPQK